MTRFFLLAFLFCVACSERGSLSFGTPVPDATLHDIWVANFRATDDPLEGQQSPPRPERIRYEKYRVSVPPTHTPGLISWPDGPPDASTDFVTVAQDSFPSAAAFHDAVVHAERTVWDRPGEIMVFVHGYNTNHAEALYLMTQVRHDFQIPVPTVLFSWPSAEVTAGYLYDRDSVLIARDHLEKVLVDISRNNRIVLMGHSMGNLLIMETLRQIELTGSMNIQDRIGALFMISPDIDGELFYTQANRLSALPQPSVILAAEKDRALRLSAFLTGRTDRLGSDVDRRAVGDLPITVIDVSAFSDGELEHKVALQSPAAIAVLNDLTGDQLPSEARFEQSIRLTPDEMRAERDAR